MLRWICERTLGRAGAVLSGLGGGWTLPIVTLLMLAASLAEVVGVASIAPFVSYVATGEVRNPVVSRLVAAFPGASPLAVLGTASFLALLFGNLLQAATTFAIYRLTWRAGETLAARIFEGLINRPFSAFIAANSSEQLTSLLHDVTSAVANVLIPFLGTIARLASTFAVVVLLIAIEPMIAVLALAVAVSSYLFAFRLLAPRIARHGKLSYELRTRLYQTAAEVFEAVREVKTFSAEAYFTKRFAKLSEASAQADARSQMMRQIPRYLIEVIAYGGMILIVILLVSGARGGDAIWPLLALYAVAAWRLLPAAQQVFGNVTSIRHHWPALESVNRALGHEPQPLPPPVSEPAVASGARPDGGPLLEFRGVRFTYDAAAAPVLSDFHLAVEPGEVVGVVGRSGSGKTTLLGLALGLLEPQSGQVLFRGGHPREALRTRSIGYVPQFPALQDDAIRRNVALGVEDDAIDDAKVRQVIEAVGLSDVVAGMAGGIEASVGERGHRLSGGQRQRLALARALYVEPSLLVLDEATSALDAATERELLDTLSTILRGRTALIVTHRPEMLGLCRRVVEI